jgi:4-amino-4-deoxy-L-arabinose transferase-like glycosyltransferase
VHESIGIYEPLAAASVAAALYLVIRLAEKPRLGLAVLLGVALGLGLLTKQSTVYSIVLLPTGLLLLSWERDGLRRRLLRWAGLNAVAVAVAAAIHSIMRLSEHYAALEFGREQLYPVRSIREGLSDPLRWLEANWPEYREAFAGYLTLPLVLAAAVGLGLLLRERIRYALVVLLWLLLPLGANVLFAELPYPRYLVLCLPPLLALTGVGLAWAVAAAASLAPRRRTIAVAAVAVIALVPAVVYDARILADPGGVEYPSLDDEQFVTGWAAGTGWEELADDLEAQAAGDPATVAVGDQFAPWIGLRLRDSALEPVVATSPRALDAEFAIQNLDPLPRLTEPPIHLQRVGLYERPRDGTPLVLYRRVAEVEGRVYASPQEMRNRLPEFVLNGLLEQSPPLRHWFETAS